MDYIDDFLVCEEVLYVKWLYVKYGWFLIDVICCFIEEIVVKIINFFNEKRV